MILKLIRRAAVKAKIYLALECSSWRNLVVKEFFLFNKYIYSEGSPIYVPSTLVYLNIELTSVFDGHLQRTVPCMAGFGMQNTPHPLDLCSIYNEK